MERRLISLMAALAIGTMGALAFAAPSNAATPAVKATSVVFSACTGPEQEVTKAAAAAIVKDISPASCLDLVAVDKCDGTTVVTMTNWAFNDNKFTVLTVELDGKEYTLKGGSDPNTEVVVLGPKVSDVQPKLVFRFTTPDGELTLKKNYGDPITWENPEACPTASPSPSVTASASPSPSVSTSTVTTAPSTTKPAAAPAGNDLPVTGASMTLSIVTFIGLLVAGVVTAVYMRFRRQRATQ